MAIGEIISSLVTTAILIPLSALLLMLSAKIFKLKDQSYLTAIKIALIVGVAGFVLSLVGQLSVALALVMSVLSLVLVSILLSVWLIMTRYKLDLSKAILVWLVWFVLELALGAIIGGIIAAIMLSLGISAIGKGMLGL